MFKRYYLSNSRSERGASMVEYALVIALILIIAIPSVSVMASKTKASFVDAHNAIGGSPNGDREDPDEEEGPGEGGDWDD